MALLSSEVERIRYELGYPVLTVGAEPYIGWVSFFEIVMKPYVSAGASTTSSTSVTAASAPTPVTLTLADATDFSQGDRVVVDVDSRQELPTIQSVSGSDIVVLLSLAHSGTYPVTVEAGETIVRDLLRKIIDVKSEMGSTFGEGGLKQVDEIQFYQVGGMSLFGSLGNQLKFWREELASAIGIESLWSQRCQGAQRMSVY